jgi:acyl-CoA synthetase (NDP forming)
MREAPVLAPPPGGRERAQAVIRGARVEGRSALTDGEAQALLAAYGIPCAPTRCVAGAAEALAAAGELGYPVALKASHPGLLHKTDAGALALGIEDPDALAGACEAISANVARAFPGASPRFLVQPMVAGGHEMILGVRLLPAYGQLVMFGLGGVFVELLRAVSFGLAPLTPGDARSMILGSPARKILEGFRGAAGGDVDALADALCRLSWLAFENPEIAEVEVNPFRVFPEGARNVALDQVVVLTEA